MKRYGKYSIILCDPPWRFKTWGKATKVGRGKTQAAQRSYYTTMTVDQLKDVNVMSLAAKDCALFVWVTWPMLEVAMQTIKGWGFRYSTVAFVWVKESKKTKRLHTGQGYWTRANTEFCLLFTRGKPKRVSRSVPQVIVASVQEHSRKPDETRERIVALMGDLPRVELFARQSVEGWEAIGDAIDDEDINDAILRIAA